MLARQSSEEDFDVINPKEENGRKFHIIQPTEDDDISEVQVSSLTTKKTSLLARIFGLGEETVEARIIRQNRENVLNERAKWLGFLYLAFIFVLGFFFLDEKTQHREIFYALMSMEATVFALVTHKMNHGLRNRKEFILLFHILFTCACRMILQIYYGPTFPIWVINTFSVVVMSNSFHFKRWSSLLNCILVIATTHGSLYLSYVLMNFRAEYGEVFQNSLERMSPVLQGFSCLSKRKEIKMTEIFIMQILVTVSGFVFSDITEKQYEENLKQQMEIVKEKFLNTSKTKFIGNLSHEVRNPLHGVVGSIQILRQEVERRRKSNQEGKKLRKPPKNFIRKSSLPNILPQPVASDKDSKERNGLSTCNQEDTFAYNQSSIELIDDIYNNSTLLLNIFSRSLQLSNLELGNIKLNICSFNMLDLLESITSVFYTMANEKGLSLQSFYNFRDVPIYVKGDNVRISQILMNIISNSVKYTQKGYVLTTCDLCTEFDFDRFGISKEKVKEIRKGVSTDDTNVYFIIIQCHDTGVGISEKDMKRLFRPFHTIDHTSQSFEQYYSQYTSSVTTDSKNIVSSSFSDRNGLGLSITKRLVKIMHGQIGVESEIQKGSTISIILPMLIGADMDDRIKKNFGACVKLENPDNYSFIIFDSDYCSRTVLHRYLNIIFPNTEVVEFDMNLDDGKVFEESSYKTLIIIYEDEFNETIQRLFYDDNRCVFIPLTNRGQSSRLSNMHYLTRPFRIEDLLEILKSLLDQESSENDSDVITMNQQKEICYGTALVVDDNNINRKVLKKMLEVIGFSTVDVAENGLEAFEMAKTNNYQIIFMDLLMPIMNGKDACLAIRRNCDTKTFIVAVTANIWESKEELTNNGGFDTVIYKPILLHNLERDLACLYNNQV